MFCDSIQLHIACDVYLWNPRGIEEGEVAEDGVPFPNKDAAGVDPGTRVENEPNGVDWNTDPGELKGLVNEAGLVCMLDGGKTEGNGRVG